MPVINPGLNPTSPRCTSHGWAVDSGTPMAQYFMYCIMYHYYYVSVLILYDYSVQGCLVLGLVLVLDQ